VTAELSGDIDKKPPGVLDMNMVLPHQQADHRIGKKFFEARIDLSRITEPCLASLHHGRALPGSSRTLVARVIVGRINRQFPYTRKMTARIQSPRALAHISHCNDHGALQYKNQIWKEFDRTGCT
jgi:hypothetical protein